MGRGRYASCTIFSRISRLLMTGMNSKSVTSDQLAFVQQRLRAALVDLAAGAAVGRDSAVDIAHAVGHHAALFVKALVDRRLVLAAFDDEIEHGVSFQKLYAHVRVRVLPVLLRVLSILDGEARAAVQTAKAEHAAVLHPDRAAVFHADGLHRALARAQAAADAAVLHAKVRCPARVIR